MLQVLVADDDQEVRDQVQGVLRDAGHDVMLARDGAEAADLVSSHAFDLAICDVQMPKLDGLTLLRRIRREAPGTAVVIMTTFANIPDVVGSLRDGAVNYIRKPFDADEFLSTVVEPIAEKRRIAQRFEVARAAFVGRATGAALVTESPAMRRLAARVAMLGASDAPVVVTGERGTGKELVARTIHSLGARRDGPLVLWEGTMLAEVMRASIEHELASGRPLRDAWFRPAYEGTLVIEDVEKLPPDAQAQLLRVLDEPAARARRDAAWQPRGVRVVTVTREDLGARVSAGQFLSSLYCRLNGADLHVPALKDRREDLCPLVAQLLLELSPPGATPSGLSPDAWTALETHEFEGNVRELRWALEQALSVADGGVIEHRHLPAAVRGVA